MATIIDWEKYNIEIPQTYRSRTYGNGKVFCPKCHDTRHDKRDKSLSVNFADGTFNCHYCGFSGCAAVQDKNDYQMLTKRKDYKKPKLTGSAALSQNVLAWFIHRGITYETLHALGVTEGIEWMPQTQSECITIQFNYYRDGELINTKFRTPDKKFKLVSGAELIPYNIDAIKGEKECIITEGEMDALTFYECGFHNVVSVPNGAQANLEYLDDYIEDYFDDKETIYIASDTDKKGLLLRDELLRRFGVERCKIVTYGENCKDANELLMKNGAEAVKNAILSALEVRVEGIFTETDFDAKLDAIYANGLQKGFTTGLQNLDNLISFETRRLMVVTGIPSHGKSEFVDMLAECLNLRYGWKWAYFSPENMPMEYHVSKLIEKFTGTRFNSNDLPRMQYEQAKMHIAQNYYFIAPPDNNRLDNVLEKARFLVRRRGVKGIVIDPYNRIECEMGNESETQYISKVLDKLTTFAQLNDVLIVLVAHPTKMKKGVDGIPECPNLYDIAGSANFYNKADFGMVVYRDRVAGCTEIHIEKVKFRHLGQTGVAKFQYNLQNGRYTPIPELGEPQPDNTNHLLKDKRSKEVQKDIDEFWRTDTDTDTDCPY